MGAGLTRHQVSYGNLTSLNSADVPWVGDLFPVVFFSCRGNPFRAYQNSIHVAFRTATFLLAYWGSDQKSM